MTDVEAVSRVDTVRDLMTEWVVTIEPADSLLKARNLMTEKRTSQLVVVDQRTRPVGLISKRNMARFLLEDPTDRDLEQIPVSEAASTSFPTLNPDLSVFNAARLFDTENLAFGVVTGDKPLSGIVTETDLCQYYSRKQAAHFGVFDFMSKDFIFAKSTYPVIHVAEAIVFRQNSVPVVDNSLVGIVTLSDLLSLREKGLGSHRHFSLRAKPDDGSALVTVKDIMTRRPVTTVPNADLAEAAQAIIKKGIGSLPVVDDESAVVGLLTKHDVVRALGRTGTDKILAV